MGGCRSILHGLTIFHVMLAIHLSNFFCGTVYNAVNISHYKIANVGRLKYSNSKRFRRKKLLPDQGTGRSHLKYLMLRCTHLSKSFKNIILIQVFRLNLRMHFSSHTCYMSRPIQCTMVQSIRSATFSNFLL
jgi:hypothetical protein